MKQQVKHAWEVPAPDYARRSFVDDGAGIYLCDGRTHLVGHHSDAEERLLERGALLVATIRIASHPRRKDRTVSHVPAARLAGPYAPAHRN